MVNVPVSETFAFRFAGRYMQRDSYVDGYWDPNQYDQRYIDGLVDRITSYNVCYTKLLRRA